MHKYGSTILYLLTIFNKMEDEKKYIHTHIYRLIYIAPHIYNSTDYNYFLYFKKCLCIYMHVLSIFHLSTLINYYNLKKTWI